MNIFRDIIASIRFHLGIDGLDRLARETAAVAESCVAALSQSNRNSDDFTKMLLSHGYRMARQAEVALPQDLAQWPVIVPSTRPLAETYAELEAAVPAAYVHWIKLLSANSDAYDGFPLHSCSVAGHPSGQYFRYFVYPQLRGRVLDVGCGPQPVPLYLQEYPEALVYGVDPISEPKSHPFTFASAVAEDLPWPDSTFDVVVAASSLDHILLLDRAYSEVVRVLRGDGVFLVWAAFVENSEVYIPTNPDIRPVDEFHLFHFSRETFEASISEWFAVDHFCRVTLEIDHYFYALRPRKR